VYLVAMSVNYVRNLSRAATSHQWSATSAYSNSNSSSNSNNKTSLEKAPLASGPPVYLYDFTHWDQDRDLNHKVAPECKDAAGLMRI
jgi:hypothetical protein